MEGELEAKGVGREKQVGISGKGARGQVGKSRGGGIEGKGDRGQ